MKALHRSDFFGWSVFDPSRNIDFHSVLWKRPGGNIVIDPLPLTDHDAAHLDALGGALLIVVTNSDHVRATAALAERTGARVAGPRAEREQFPVHCDEWLGEGEEPAEGLRVYELQGSKTPGELALSLDGSVLVFGDLVRAHQGGRLNLLPDAKIKDKASAKASVERLAALEKTEAVLVGDGWPVFRDGKRALEELVRGLGA
jgi:glyoxylase-like metal-dependent hydrolase (beta-lactamase superfamily II)